MNPATFTIISWILSASILQQSHGGLMRSTNTLSTVRTARTTTTIPVLNGGNSTSKLTSTKRSKKQSKLHKLWRKKLRKLAKINDEITHLRPRVSQSDRDLLLRQQVRDLLEASKSTSDFNSAISEEKSQPHQGWRQSLIAELIKLNGQLQNAPMNGLVLLNSKTSPPTYTSLMISTTTSSVWNETTVQSSTQVQKRKRKQNKSSVKVARLLKNLKSTSGSSTTASHRQTLPKKFPMGSSVKPVGVAGAKCLSHQDCKPGLCCHQSSLNSTQLTCYNHSQSVGTRCANSCQCQNDLMCFRAKAKVKLNHKRLHTGHSHWDKVVNNKAIEENNIKIENHLEGRGMCKVASIEDIHHGDYANNKHSLFTGTNLPV